MSKTPTFYLIKDDGEVESTDDADIAAAAASDGSTLVINTKTNEASFDSDVQAISAADRDDWITEEDEEEEIEGLGEDD